MRASFLKNQHIRAVLFLAGLCFVVFFFFQNCSPFSIMPRDTTFLSLNNFESSEDCYHSQVQSCLFFKNPWYSRMFQEEEGFELEENWAQSHLNSFQTHGISLQALNLSGFLENESFSVWPHEGERISVNVEEKDDLKFRYPSSGLSQITAYYWTHKTLSLIISFQTEEEESSDQESLTVFTGHSVTGWSSRNKAIYLRTDPDRSELDASLSAETIIHLASEADLFFQTKGAVYDIQDQTKYTVCGLMTDNQAPVFYEDRCCSSRRGCSKALIFGQADYIVSLFFPEAPVVGESYSESAKGLSYCGILRNLEQAQDKKAEDFFKACSEKGMPGQVFTMGILYASLWWDVRQQAALQKREHDVDRLFFLHRLELTGDDDIVTAFEKVKVLDKALFASDQSLSSLFSEALKRKGL